MTDENNTNEKFKQKQEEIILKLMPTIRTNGFQTLRMDEIAKIVGISRATLYKYFPAKEDLFHRVTDGFVQYIKEMTSNIPNEDTVFASKFQLIIEQSVSLALFITDDFLNELQSTYPLMYDKVWDIIQFREQQLLIFYSEGMKNGVFNNINGRLLILQDQMLFSILDLKYLMKNQFSIEQALLDFYQLRKLQLFKPDKLSTVDDSLMMPRIEYLSQKISKVLY
ncbi:MULTISPECIES: TetR/AcrR family transcriptional regulator [unclassified Bacillus (in: firmicutes)]|uniref:TetR/AcrR family transcriptional regulator n=1 Tax=unclassified Bacillus (in: firmicutes) TaxID=185979 RepID=UPI000BF09BD6|nr:MULTISPECIES: TetR/AcrR family transcriptional regulator [unclassified Bacillus (in: firmicutes)]PEJ57072.1 TetR family transcriptional regulator [Bacillus sp. AFS002410]PEL09237.1 TetR family transcriptional regulator [Bacillus sp. AFS017336]